MKIVITLILLLCVHFESKGFMACAKAQPNAAVAGMFRSAFVMIVLFCLSIYILHIGSCNKLLQFE